jgi:hypothetical protein
MGVPAAIRLKALPISASDASYFPKAVSRCDSLPHHCCAENAVNCFLRRPARPPTIDASKRVTYATGGRTEMALLNMMRMVLWSFFGVRRGAAHEADLASVNLPLLPVMAVVLALCFGGLLFAFARIAVTVAH